MPRRKEYTSSNARLQPFTERFRKEVDESGGVTSVSEQSGISRNTISYWYYGARTPDAGNLVTIANTFGCSTDYLLGLKDIRTPDPQKHDATSYTGLSEQTVSDLHDVLSKNHNAIKLIEGFIDYFGLHGDTLSQLNRATECAKKAKDGNNNFNESAYYFSESIKRTFGITDTRGSITLPDGVVPLSSADAVEFYIDCITRSFRQFLSNYVKQQSSGEFEEEDNNGKES